MLFDRHWTPCLTSPESEHYSLAFLPHRYASFPYSCIPHRYPYPFLSFLVSHPSPPSLSSPLFASLFMSAGSASQFPPFSHSPPPSQPTSHPFPCGDFSSVKCLPGLTTPQPTYSLRHSLNGCSIKERGRGEELKPSFLPPCKRPPLWLSQKWYVPQRGLQKLREHIVCNLALQGSLPDSCVRSLSPAPIPSLHPHPSSLCVHPLAK